LVSQCGASYAAKRPTTCSQATSPPATPYPSSSCKSPCTALCCTALYLLCCTALCCAVLYYTGQNLEVLSFDSAPSSPGRDLSGNQLSGPLPDAISSLTRLSQLSPPQQRTPGEPARQLGQERHPHPVRGKTVQYSIVQYSGSLSALYCTVFIVELHRKSSLRFVNVHDPAPVSVSLLWLQESEQQSAHQPGVPGCLYQDAEHVRTPIPP